MKSVRGITNIQYDLITFKEVQLCGKSEVQKHLFAHNVQIHLSFMNAVQSPHR